ncbi:MAG TPA: histidine kinase [Steroidobacteraceae bacterium]
MRSAPGKPNWFSSNANGGLFAIWALFWLLMIAVSVEDHGDRRYFKWWEPYLWEGSSCLFATGWLLLQRRVATRWNVYLAQPLRWFGRHLAWFPLFAVTFVPVVYSIRHGVYSLAHYTYKHDPWPHLFVYETIKLLLYTALWLCILFGFASFTLWRQERERLLTLQKDLAESQLAQLRAQLQPHFIFNALNTISSLMQIDVGRADRLLAQLADLLRSTLQAGNRQANPLREELKVLQLYSDIMRERFAGRVLLSWDIANEALDAAVPALLLQPLLENAFKHGVERCSQPVAIAIAAWCDERLLHVTIHNTGGALATDSRPGIGLTNCRERLKVLYGEHARLDLAQDATGVAARISLPYQSEAA